MMSSSEVAACAIGLMLVLSSAPAAAQQFDEDQRGIALEQYNTATAIEREAFEDRRGGPGSDLLRRAHRDCALVALASYHTMPTKLAAWRVVSCAVGDENWLLVVLATIAFATEEPLGIAGWSHPSFAETEVVRVRAAAAAAPLHVGAVRLTIPPGAEVFWGPHGPPLELSAPRALPPSDADLRAGAVRRGPVRVGDLFIMPAGARFAAVVTQGAAVERIDVTVRALTDGGIQEARPSVSSQPAAPVQPPAPIQPPAPERPEVPSATALDAAFLAMQPRVLASCSWLRGTTTIQVQLSGRTGRITAAVPVTGSTLGSCVIDAITPAFRVTAFSRPVFETTRQVRVP